MSLVPEARYKVFRKAQNSNLGFVPDRLQAKKSLNLLHKNQQNLPKLTIDAQCRTSFSQNLFNMRHPSMKVNTFDVTEFALQGQDIDFKDKVEKFKLKNNANRVMKTLSQRKSQTGRD